MYEQMFCLKTVQHIEHKWYNDKAESMVSWFQRYISLFWISTLLLKQKGKAIPGQMYKNRMVMVMVMVNERPDCMY